ncbi:MAG: lipopolysaccharide transport periplasmic protein LptA [Mariprofundaceae bacterium]|nr:lipopolysaccharide transport periplasmic protein LptA [Mariprofundaceae bacterium]
MKLWITMICLIWSGAAWAEDAIQIESDHMHMSTQQNRATFTGSVLLTRNDFELRCDRLVVDYLNKKIQHAVATGHVRMHQGAKHGVSDQAIFEQTTNQVTLIGHASVENEKGVLRGYKIIHDITQGDTEVLQEPGKRVRLHIETDQTSQGQHHE